MAVFSYEKPSHTHFNKVAKLPMLLLHRNILMIGFALPYFNHVSWESNLIQCGNVNILQFI
jgi:hypothetical protein